MGNEGSCDVLTCCTVLSALPMRQRACVNVCIYNILFVTSEPAGFVQVQFTNEKYFLFTKVENLFHTNLATTRMVPITRKKPANAMSLQSYFSLTIVCKDNTRFRCKLYST